MTISDDRSVSPAPAPPPPSFVRRHPIVAGFGVLSGLSLFSALWPVSAIVISVAIAGHVTGLDRAAWSLTRSLANRVTGALRDHVPVPPAPAPVAPEPTAPAPSAPVAPGPTAPAPSPPVAPGPAAPAPSAPKRNVHAPAPQVRPGGSHGPASHAPVRPRRTRTPDHPVETRVDGPGL